MLSRYTKIIPYYVHFLYSVGAEQRTKDLNAELLTSKKSVASWTRRHMLEAKL